MRRRVLTVFSATLIVAATALVAAALTASTHAAALPQSNSVRVYSTD